MIVQSQSKTTKQWQAADAAHHLHPFSDMASLNRDGSRVIVKANGIYLWDSDGNKILDGMAGLWCVNAGYGREEIIQAIQEQLKTLPFYNTFFRTTHPAVIELGETLAEVTSSQFNHFFYANGGSDANDTVVRLVHAYWSAIGKPEKRYFISRQNGYHGSTIAGASLGGMGYMHEQMASRMENVAHIMDPNWFANGGDLSPEEFGLQCAGQLETKILQLGAENVAAFIAEPFQGAGGVIFPPSTYWPEIQRICKKYNVLLCADEVISGFGRVGEWFAHQHFGFEPDTLTMAKGLTSGYVPMGAVAISGRMAEVISHAGSFNHGLTYSGHPVAAAAAVANIRLLQKSGFVEQVKHDTGPYFQKALREALADNPIIGEISGVGLVAGMQLTEDKASRKRFENGYDISIQCRDHCLNNNLMMRAMSDRMILSPSLCITRSEIDELIEKAKLSIDTTARELGRM